MFKNKFVLLILFVSLLLIVFYSLKSDSDFASVTKKSFEEYKNNLINASLTPIEKNRQNDFDFFEPDEQWIIQCNFEPKDSVLKFAMTDSSLVDAKLAGIATFSKNNIKSKLLIFKEENNLLLPFKDLSAGKETYGGGRYINISNKALSGHTITIDFNKARNFYCAYSHNYVCPMPPTENTINLKVTAGEKKFKGQ